MSTVNRQSSGRLREFRKTPRSIRIFENSICWSDDTISLFNFGRGWSSDYFFVIIRLFLCDHPIISLWSVSWDEDEDDLKGSLKIQEYRRDSTIVDFWQRNDRHKFDFLSTDIVIIFVDSTIFTSSVTRARPHSTSRIDRIFFADFRVVWRWWLMS